MTKYTITVDVPDDVNPGEWMLVRALLDAIESGSSGHTLGLFDGGVDGASTRYRHQRLGTDITISWED